MKTKEQIKIRAREVRQYLRKSGLKIRDLLWDEERQCWWDADKPRIVREGF